MGDLKPGWKRVKFGQVVRLSKDSTKDPIGDGLNRYIGLEHIEPGDLRVRSWGDVSDGTTFTRRFRPGQVLFGKRRAYQRKIAVADCEGVCSGDIYVFEPKDPKVLLPELLPFLCQTDRFFDYAIGTSAGSLSPRTNWKSLAEYEFALPPLEQQRQIARVLRHAGELVNASSDGLSSLNRAKDAAVAQALQFGLHGAALAPTSLGPRPTHWQTCAVTERYDVQLGKMISKKTRSGGVRRPYLRNANVDWGSLSLEGVLEMSLREDELERYELRPGDIVACEGRHVGKSAVWRGEIEGACYQKALHRLRARGAEDLPEFMLHTLRYYSFSGRLVRHTTGTTIPHLPLANLRALAVAFPPKEEQAEIVSFIDEFDEARNTLRRRIDGARSLIRVVMNEARLGTL